MNTYTSTIVTVQGSGSGTSYASAIDETVDVGTASRGPKQKESTQALFGCTPGAVCFIAASV